GLGWLAASFAGLIFALLPIQAEVGSWISGRADSIPSSLYLGSLLLFGLWRQQKSSIPPIGQMYGSHVGAAFRGPGLFAGSCALFFAALFSKQSAITMLATLLSYDLLVERR